MAVLMAVVVAKQKQQQQQLLWPTRMFDLVCVCE